MLVNSTVKLTSTRHPFVHRVHSIPIDVVIFLKCFHMSKCKKSLVEGIVYKDSKYEHKSIVLHLAMYQITFEFTIHCGLFLMVTPVLLLMVNNITNTIFPLMIYFRYPNKLCLRQLYITK